MQSPCFPQPHSKWLGDQCDYKLSTPIATCRLRGRIIGNFRTRYLGFINGVCCNAVKNLWQEMCEERCQRIGMCIILDTLPLSHHHIPGNWSNFSSTFSKRKIEKKCERQERFLITFCLQGSLLLITKQIRNYIFNFVSNQLVIWENRAQNNSHSEFLDNPFEFEGSSSHTKWCTVSDMNPI